MDPLGIVEMLSHDFMRNAFVAGTAIAIASGLVGHFVVLRRQVFAGDALSHVTFSGALAALAIGVDVRVGAFLGALVIALVFAAVGRRGQADDIVIGVVFAWALGLGVLFLSLYTAHRSTANGTGGVSVLFGSILGLDAGRTIFAVAIATVVTLVIAVIARPLLFASIDATVAEARGIPVRMLGAGFLVALAVTAAEATQAVGALLLLGLLAAPAAAAQRLTTRPYRALVLSAVVAVTCTWLGLAFSYQVSRVPPSTAIVLALALTYAMTAVFTRAVPG